MNLRAGLLPKLLITPSALLVLVCVYGYIMFTFHLSFTPSTMMPQYQLGGAASYERLLGLENWSVALSNLWVFASLYIVCTLVLGLERTMHLVGWESFAFSWIKDSSLAIYCVVIAAVWQTTGFVMAMFLAGLRGVDSEQINAARVDGAKTWKIYLRIIIPQLGPVFVSAFVILAHMAVKSYDLVIALTNGGPGRSTWLPSAFMYQYTFTRSEMAVGAASSVESHRRRLRTPTHLPGTRATAVGGLRCADGSRGANRAGLGSGGAPDYEVDQRVNW